MSRFSGSDSRAQKAAISAFAAPTYDDPEVVHSRESSSGRTKDSDSVSIQSRHTLRTFAANIDDAEDPDAADPWSTIPRSNRRAAALNEDSTELLTTQQRRQLLMRALMQLVVLFVVCLVGLGGTLWLALPVISPDDKPLFKIPRNFDDLKALNGILQHYKNEHFVRVLICWFIVYLFLQAFSIPGSMYMSILAGALFGVPIALPLVCTTVATGATICYLISKFLGVVLIALPSWKARMDQWKDKLADHEGDLLSYLIILRMMPLPPHNIVNIMSPHLGIGIPVFWLSTFGGIFASSVIHTTIGEKLDQMTSADDFHLFSLRNCLLLGGVGLAVMLPVLMKKYGRSAQLDQGTDTPAHGPLFLTPEDGEEDAQDARLPPSFRRNLVGQQRGLDTDDDDDDDDELPPRSLSTDNIADHQDAFPTWGRDSRIGEDEFEADTHTGVFPDRRQSHSASSRTTSTYTTATTDKLKDWISKGTGLHL